MSGQHRTERVNMTAFSNIDHWRHHVMIPHAEPSPSLCQRINALSQEIFPEIVALRRHLHQNPELSWQEFETSAFIMKTLADIPGIQDVRRIAKVGVVAHMNGSKPGKTIALRADMDALSLSERGELPYQSKNDGVMHACGHDGHMAILLGAAKVLSRMRNELAGSVRFIFQPAEEGGFGALRLCEEGVLTMPDVDAIFALHAWPGIPLGRVGIKSGPLMAADSHFKITVEGKGCHAAMPHLGTDQILIMARIIEALQAVRSRQTSPTEHLALTITKIYGGTAINIIPATVFAEGTLRTTEPATRDRCVSAMQTLVTHTAKAHGAHASLEVTHHYPVTCNAPVATHHVRRVAHRMIGAENTLEIEAPSMGAEDFSYYLQKVPGSFFFLGVDSPAADGPLIALHHPSFDFNDEALPTGISMLTALALTPYQTPSCS